MAAPFIWYLTLMTKSLSWSGLPLNSKNNFKKLKLNLATALKFCHSLIMKIEFAKPTKFEVPVEKVWTISSKMKQWMKRRAQQLETDIHNDDLWLKGGERAY